MAIEAQHPADDRPTIGVDAVELGRFAHVETADDGLLVYDHEGDDAWIQSDVYFPRATCV